MLATVAYRNPAEEWLWESGFLPWMAVILLGVIIFAGAVIAAITVCGWFRKGRGK